MKRSEHRNIIGDDEPVWEHAGARLGGVFIGKMQLVLEDECGPYRRETCMKVWMGQPCCTNPLVFKQLVLEDVWKCLWESTACHVVLSHELWPGPRHAALACVSSCGLCSLCCWRQEQCGPFCSTGDAVSFSRHNMYTFCSPATTRGVGKQLNSAILVLATCNSSKC